MNPALPGIAALEAIGASLLTIERRLNLAPAPELTRSANAWQIFANPLERLDELVPPLSNSADRPMEKASEQPTQASQMTPGLPLAARPSGFTTGAAQTSAAPRRAPLAQSAPASEYAQRTPGQAEYRPFDLGPARAAFSGGDLQPNAYNPATISQPDPRRSNSGPATTQTTQNSTQIADPSVNQNSATRLVSNASGLAALLQANLKQSSLEPGSPLRPQAAPPEPRSGPRTAPSVSTAANNPQTYNSQTSASETRRSQPAELAGLAAETQAFSYPDFLPSALAADALSGQSGQIQSVPAAVSSLPIGRARADQPSAPASPDIFQTWLDDLELAYLRLYGTSGS